MPAINQYISLADKDLLLQIAADDARAFDAVYEKYWSILLHTANKRLHDREASMDAVQNVFIDLWARRKDVSIENLPAYLQQATRFQVYKQISNSKKKTPFLQLLDNILSSDFTADCKLMDKEMQSLLNDWIETLPPKQKKIFLLYLNRDLSTKEMSAELNIPRKTIQNLLSISLNDLQKNVFKSSLFFILLEFIEKY